MIKLNNKDHELFFQRSELASLRQHGLDTWFSPKVCKQIKRIESNIARLLSS